MQGLVDIFKADSHSFIYLVNTYSQQIRLSYSAAPKRYLSDGLLNLSCLSMSGHQERSSASISCHLNQNLHATWTKKNNLWNDNSLDIFHNFSFSLGCCLLGCVLVPYLYLLRWAISFIFVHISVGLVLESIFSFIELFVYLYTNKVLSWLPQLYNKVFRHC